jgi:hypothetical protein
MSQETESKQKYRVVVGDYQDLIEVVNQYVTDGYSCLGGVAVIPDQEEGDHKYAQALILRDFTTL